FHAIRRAIAEHFGLHVHAALLLKAGSIPKTSSGKLQRHACCAGYLDGSLDLIDTSVDEPTSSEAVVSLAELQAARTAERLPMLVAYIRSELARVLHVLPTRIDVKQPLNSLGLDSLMAVEAKHAVERKLEITLPVTAFLRESSASDLASSILSMLTLTP